MRSREETTLDPGSESRATTPKPTPSPLLRLLAAAAALGLLVVVGRGAGDHVAQFTAWVDGLGFWGPAVFAVAYVVATVAFVPGSLLTLAAGALFGVVPGTVVVFLAATVGAALAFLIARHLARSAIEQRVAGNPRFDAIDRAVANEGRKIVLLLRLSPVFPFNFLNYALGLTRVRFFDYVIASVGMLPGTLLYVYTGAVAGEVAIVAGGVAPERGAGTTALWIVGLLATVAVTAFVTRTARRALAQVTGE